MIGHKFPVSSRKSDMNFARSLEFKLHSSPIVDTVKSRVSYPCWFKQGNDAWMTAKWEDFADRSSKTKLNNSGSAQDFSSTASTTRGIWRIKLDIEIGSCLIWRQETLFWKNVKVWIADITISNKEWMVQTFTVIKNSDTSDCIAQSLCTVMRRHAGVGSRLTCGGLELDGLECKFWFKYS